MIRATFEGQPKALAPLFFVELWERFGFYAVQGVLVLYLTKAFGFSDDKGYDIFSVAAALLYASPFIGGYLADRILGYRRSILIGAIFLMLGYWCLIVRSEIFFYWSLAFLIIGNGFFKSCISTLLGTLYSDPDPRRDGGFTIFYMGINIGSFLGPLASGYLMEHQGWPWVFAAAGLGLLIAFGIALATFKMLGDKGLPPEKMRHSSKPTLLVLAGALLTVLVLGFFMHNAEVANIIFVICVFACILGVIVLAFRCQGQEKTNMLILIILTIFSIIFWALYNQTFSSLSLFTDRIINRHIFGITIPTANFQSVNPFFIIVLTPIFVRLWYVVDKNHHWLSYPASKFAGALWLMALGYFVLVLGIMMHHTNGMVSMFWLNFSYFLQTVGELMISPIGLSVVTELAPEKYRGMMMGAWFLSIAGGYSVGDYLAKFSSVPSDQMAKSIPVLQMLHYYSHAFTLFFALTVVGALLLTALIPLLNRALDGHRKPGIAN